MRPIAQGTDPKWRGKYSESNGVMGCRGVSQVPWRDSACARVGTDTQCQEQPWEHPEGHGDALQDTKRPCRTRPQDLGDFSPTRGGSRDTGGGTGTHRRGRGHMGQDGDTQRGDVTGSHGGGLGTYRGEVTRCNHDTHQGTMLPHLCGCSHQDASGDTQCRQHELTGDTDLFPCHQPVPRGSWGPLSAVALGHPGGCHSLPGHLSPAEQCPHPALMGGNIQLGHRGGDSGDVVAGTASGSALPWPR